MRRRDFLWLGCVMGLAACAGDPSSTPVPPGVPGLPGVVVPGSQLEGLAAFIGPARLVPVGDIQIACRQFGQGPHLLLIMGVGGDMEAWDLTLLADLARTFTVTIYDHRGVRDSTDNLQVAYTVHQLAADAAALIGVLGLGFPDVVGWSMGGETALALLVSFPGRVRRVITTGAGQGGPAEQRGASADLLSDPNASSLQILNALYPASAEREKLEYAASLEVTGSMRLSAVTQQRQRELALAYLQDTSIFDALPRRTTPLLVTHGLQDVIIPASNAENLAAQARCGLEIFEAGGHAMHFQQFARFAELVRAFLGG